MDTSDYQHWQLVQNHRDWLDEEMVGGFLEDSCKLNLEQLDFNAPASEGTSGEAAGGSDFQMFDRGSAVGLQSQILNDCMWTGLGQEKQQEQQQQQQCRQLHQSATLGQDVALQKLATMVMGGEGSSRSLEPRVGLIKSSLMTPVSLRTPLKPTQSWHHIPNGSSLLIRNYLDQEQQQPHQKKQAEPVSTRNGSNIQQHLLMWPASPDCRMPLPVPHERCPVRDAFLAQQERQVLASTGAEHLYARPDRTTCTIASDQQCLLLHKPVSTPPSFHGKSQCHSLQCYLNYLEDTTHRHDAPLCLNSPDISLPQLLRDLADIEESSEPPLLSSSYQHDDADLYDHHLHQQPPVPRGRTCVLHRSFRQIYSAWPTHPYGDEAGDYADVEEADGKEEKKGCLWCSKEIGGCDRMHAVGGPQPRYECHPVTYYGDHNYTHSQVRCTVQTTSDTMEEIDVVSIDEKSMPTARNRRHLKSSRPPSYEQNAERRHYSKLVEQQMRVRLKHLFEELKRQIPSLKNKDRVSKQMILREASALCKRLNRRSERVNELRQRQKQLYEQVQQLVSEDKERRRSEEKTLV